MMVLALHLIVLQIFIDCSTILHQSWFSKCWAQNCSLDVQFFIWENILFLMLRKQVRNNCSSMPNTCLEFSGKPHSICNFLCLIKLGIILCFKQRWRKIIFCLKESTSLTSRKYSDGTVFNRTKDRPSFNLGIFMKRKRRLDLKKLIFFAREVGLLYFGWRFGDIAFFGATPVGGVWVE